MSTLERSLYYREEVEKLLAEKDADLDTYRRLNRELGRSVASSERNAANWEANANEWKRIANDELTLQLAEARRLLAEWVTAAMSAQEALSSIKGTCTPLAPSQYGMMCAAIRGIQKLWEPYLEAHRAVDALQSPERGKEPAE